MNFSAGRDSSLNRADGQLQKKKGKKANELCACGQKAILR
jgi:hypothetical protein